MPNAGEQAISDAAVRARTGKAWNDWFAILDRWGAKDKDHKTIAAYLKDKRGLSPWWSQTVTVRYEQERGIRAVGQRAGGKFEVSVQRTIGASTRKAFEAFTDPAHVRIWFSPSAKADLRQGGHYENSEGDHGVYTLFAPPKRVKFTWENKKHCPGTVVEVTFASAGRNRSVVRLQHAKLKSKKDREKMKEGWSWALDSLKSYLETGQPVRHEDWLKKKK